MQNLERYLIVSLFGGYVVKLLAMGCSVSDAAIVLVLAASHYLYSKDIQNKKVNELKAEVASLRSSFEELKNETKEMKTAVAGVKIAQGLRPVGSK